MESGMATADYADLRGFPEGHKPRESHPTGEPFAARNDAASSVNPRKSAKSAVIPITAFKFDRLRCFAIFAPLR
jgi:hypothetical protein